MLITSNGAIKFEAPHAPGKPFRSCEEKLPGKELQILGETVRQSRPDEWKIQGPNAAAPDAFEYELELRQGGKEQVYKVKWYDNTHDQLPDDLKKLSEAVNQAMEWAANKCR